MYIIFTYELQFQHGGRFFVLENQHGRHSFVSQSSKECILHNYVSQHGGQ